MRHPITHAFMFLLLLTLCTACGPRMQSTTNQTPQEVEQSNPSLHLHSSTITGNTEVRIYRNWSWTSVGSYFKPNRNYRLTFIDGHLVSWAEL